MSKYSCNGCAVMCQAVIDDACDCRPTACLFSDIAKNYDPIWTLSALQKSLPMTEEELHKIVRGHFATLFQAPITFEEVISRCNAIAHALYTKLTGGKRNEI